MSIKPYFRPENTHNIELDELEATAELDELRVPAELDELGVPAELDKIEVPLPTLEVSQEPTKPAEPAVKRS